MVKFTWYNGEVDEKLKITQVYGIIFTMDGRILLKVERKKEDRVYSLAGGKPESYDKDMEETLRRELLEEINTTIKCPILVGYQLVDEGNTKEPYAQVRMAALIDNIGLKKIDSDNGKLYDRLLTTPSRAIELLDWGETGKQQIEAAYKIAKEKFNIKNSNLLDEWI